MTVTFQSKMNDDKYLIEEVEKEYFSEYKFEEIIHELNQVHKYVEEPKKKIQFRQCVVCQENKTIPEFYKYSTIKDSKICKRCFVKTSII
jgi:hypothetical protein